MYHNLKTWLTLMVLAGSVANGCADRDSEITTIFLAGDSTVADYTQYDNYMTDRSPVNFLPG